MDQEVPANCHQYALADDYVRDASGGGALECDHPKDGDRIPIVLLHEAFHRQIGIFASIKANPEGNIISDAEWNANVDTTTKEDGAFIQSLMVPL